MTLRVRPARGLASLHTLASRADERMPAHKAYLRISFLELQRARHGQEMTTARGRLESLRTRCERIEHEKAAILASIGQPPAAARPRAASTGHSGARRKPRFQVAY